MGEAQLVKILKKERNNYKKKKGAKMPKLTPGGHTLFELRRTNSKKKAEEDEEKKEEGGRWT